MARREEREECRRAERQRRVERQKRLWVEGRKSELSPAQVLIHVTLGHLHGRVQVRPGVRDLEDPQVVLEARDEVRKVVGPCCREEGSQAKKMRGGGGRGEGGMSEAQEKRGRGRNKEGVLLGDLEDPEVVLEPRDEVRQVVGPRCRGTRDVRGEEGKGSKEEGSLGAVSLSSDWQCCGQSKMQYNAHPCPFWAKWA